MTGAAAVIETMEHIVFAGFEDVTIKKVRALFDTRGSFNSGKMRLPR